MDTRALHAALQHLMPDEKWRIEGGAPHYALLRNSTDSQVIRALDVDLHGRTHYHGPFQRAVPAGRIVVDARNTDSTSERPHSSHAITVDRESDASLLASHIAKRFLPHFRRETREMELAAAELVRDEAIREEDSRILLDAIARGVGLNEIRADEDGEYSAESGDGEGEVLIGGNIARDPHKFSLCLEGNVDAVRDALKCIAREVCASDPRRPFELEYTYGLGGASGVKRKPRNRGGEP